METLTIYKQTIKKSMQRLLEVIKSMQCRPILFIGTGLSIRYMDSPSWRGLLEELVECNADIDRPLQYFIGKVKRENNNQDDYTMVASYLDDYYSEYGWKKGVMEANEFPESIYEEDFSTSIFLKIKIIQLLERRIRMFEEMIRDETHPYLEEIQLLAKTDPHAIITTNYDSILETIFEQFTPVIGQNIIRKPFYESYGEILKIHGCVNEPESIVITKEDYDNFKEKKKYLSARLLAYFVEHPLIIIGYSLQDENIRLILQDIAQMIESPNELIENIWVINWEETIDEDVEYAPTTVIDIGEGKTLHVNQIVLNDFKELYATISEQVPVERVDVKVWRSLARTVHNLVHDRHSYLKVNIAAINYFSQEENLVNILSIADFNPESLGAIYVYTTSDISESWGFPKRNTYPVLQVINKIKELTGIDIRETQNIYHLDINKDSSKAAVRRYSASGKQLLTDVHRGISTKMISPIDKSEIIIPGIEVAIEDMSTTV